MTGTHVFLPILFLAFAATAGAETEKAQPKEGRPFGDSLSEHIPDSISSLPKFGAIEWETTHLPWVAEGPYDGISGTAMDVLDGKIYVMGGFMPGGDGSGDPYSDRSSRSCWQYDPDTKAWTQMADAPVRREYVRGVAAEGKFYIAGGAAINYNRDGVARDVGVRYGPYSEVAAFDPNDGPTGSWELIAPLNVPRTHMGVGYAGGKLLFVGGNEYDRSTGGYSSKTIRRTVEALDLNDVEAGWKVMSPIPGLGRGWCASAALNDKLYVFGGLTWLNEKDVNTATGETLCYDPATDTWSFLMPPPDAISGWEGDIYADRYMLLVGGTERRPPGSKGKRYWSDLTIAYDIEENEWLQVDGILPPGAVFNDPAVAVIGDTIYVLGAEGQGGSHFDYFLIGHIQPE